MRRAAFHHRLSGGVLVLAIAGCGVSDTSSQDAANSAATAAGVASQLAPALAERLALLESRAGLVQDTSDVKQLQRAFGYYFDAGRWDEAAALFAADGTIEFGLDGVYEGRARVREYLQALGGGIDGLAEGQLHEQLQIMPVVNVAPDGLTAQGRWRGIVMNGQLGENAYWGEGTFENDYVKEGSEWKIRSLHWYQSFYVPYAGGWQQNRDANGGKWVSQDLPPDRPSSIEYSVWPQVYVPAFHFVNPGTETGGSRPPPDAQMTAARQTAAAGTDPAQRVAALTRHVDRLEDEDEIERLQRMYGYYIDKQLWSEAAELFAADGSIEVGGSGVYVGRARVREYLQTLGPEYPQDGRLFDRMQLQPIVHVAADGQTARARWHLFAQEALHGEYAQWGLGVYENSYVKVDDAWRILDLHLYVRMYTPYEDGWGQTAIPLTGPSTTVPPDRPPSVTYEAFPSAFIAPFHFDRLFARPASAAPSAVTVSADPAQVEALLGDLDRRIGLLEDMDQLERLNAVYGYYLAHSQSDNMAAIFDLDGTIEIALRGVYVGRPSVRRNLDLYTEPGIQYGLLHNHMQFQPVIHIDAGGTTAKMRSRAFSIMGDFERYAQWMGGVYENEFEKEGGVWRIKKDQVFNTFFSPYAAGWKDLAQRAPPGISPNNPPDRPPSVQFDMYPKAFLPPFHYNASLTVPGEE